MPLCNARRLALANSMPYCVIWGPDLHPRPPGKGQFRCGRSGPLWSVGITHDNVVAHGHKMTWLIPFKLGTILQLDHLQRWAWPDDVIRPMPLVLGRQAEPDSDWLAQCPCPQILSISSALNRLNDPEMKAFFTVRRRSFNSILSNARPTSISSYRITTKKSQILGTGSCTLALAGVNCVVYGSW